MKRQVQLLLTLLVIFSTGIITFVTLLRARTVEAAPLKQFSPPTQIKLKMYALTQGGARRKDSQGNYLLCSPTSGTRDAYGCTWYYDIPGQSDERIENYPFDDDTIEIGYETELKQVTMTTGTATVQLGYLHNVTPLEVAIQVSSQGNKPLSCVKAQAIAARTFGYNQTYDASNPTVTKRINNSNEKQVYIPFRYDGATSAQQQRVDEAVSEVLYMTAPGSDLPILAHYGADNDTTTGQGNTSYLKSVYDPISVLGRDSGTGNGGMASRGCSRWGFGHTSSHGPVAPSDPNYPHDDDGDGDFWSVRWDNAFQILTHYYTRIDLRNANEQIISPDFRWDILQQQTTPPNPAPGAAFTAAVTLQNTGVFTWPNNNNYPLFYWWVNSAGQQVTTPALAGKVTELVGPGDDITLTASLVSPSSGGPYTLTYRLGTSYDWTQTNFDTTNTRANPAMGPLGSITTLWQTSGTFANQLLADGTRVYYKDNGFIQAASLAINGQNLWSYNNSGIFSFNGTLVGERYISKIYTAPSQPYNLVALNASSGAPVWSYSLNDNSTLRSPLASNGRVFEATKTNANTPQGLKQFINLYNFDPISGGVGWGGQPSAIGGIPITWSVYQPQTPAVSNGVVYVAYDSEYVTVPTVAAVSVSALSEATGSLLWTTDVISKTPISPCTLISPPVVGGSRAFMGTFCGSYQIVALNLTTRQRQWVITQAGSDTFNSSFDVNSLAYFEPNSRLIVTGETEIWVLNAATGQQVWRWQAAAGQSVQTEAIIAANRVWVASGTGTGNWRWHVLAMSDGAQLATWTAPANVGLPSDFPIISNNLLLFTTADGQRWALKISPIYGESWFDQPVSLQ